MSKNFDIQTFQNNISLNIKHLRNMLNLNQIELGNEIGAKRGLINNYENKKSMPPLDLLCELSKLAGVSLDIFINQSISEVNPIVNDPGVKYETTNLEKRIKDLEKIINLLERENEFLRSGADKSKTA